MEQQGASRNLAGNGAGAVRPAGAFSGQHANGHGGHGSHGGHGGHGGNAGHGVIRPAPASVGMAHAGLDLAEEAEPIRRVAIASDHRGFEAKRRVLELLRERIGTTLDAVHDLGPEEGGHACDYPDFAIPVARRVAAGEVDVAGLLDGSGIGMGIAANKVAGVRAATCHDEITARIAREHNHCNVLCVGTDLVGERTLLRVSDTFLATPFAGGRHVRRVAKLLAHEAATFMPEMPRQARRMSS